MFYIYIYISFYLVWVDVYQAVVTSINFVLIYIYIYCYTFRFVHRCTIHAVDVDCPCVHRLRLQALLFGWSSEDFSPCKGLALKGNNKKVDVVFNKELLQTPVAASPWGLIPRLRFPIVASAAALGPQLLYDGSRPAIPSHHAKMNLAWLRKSWHIMTPYRCSM